VFFWEVQVSRWRHGSKPVIGLIGGIGAGKSTAARCFEQRGGRVIDADSIGHTALQRTEIVQKIVQRWGDRVAKTDGQLDRRAIARIVFANPEERNALEKTVFPFIGEQCLKKIKEALDDSNIRFAVLDAAVLLEAGWNENVDRIVYIDAPRELRLARVAARSGWTEEDLTARETSQWPAELKKAKSDAVLVNKDDSEELQRQINELLESWHILND
jgi:dephospho-CoA kinase